MSAKFEIRISKYETNSNTKCPNDKNKIATAEMFVVWIIGIFVIMYCFGFRISCFECRVFSFRKAAPLNSDLALKTRFIVLEFKPKKGCYV
jgi:hypothetical protein